MIIPDDMIEACGHVFAGEYDVKNYRNEKPTILDIGANVGAFSVWSTYRWPNAVIHAYEPVRETYDYLVRNTEHLDSVITHNEAVSSQASEERLILYGGNNRGQSSFYYNGEQRDHGEMVRVISAESLPYANIVKIDTEGSEVDILQGITFIPDLFLIEFHSIEHKDKILSILDEKFALISLEFGNVRRGLIKMASKAIL